MIESSLYALGGHGGGNFLNLVQKLSLESLTWELTQLKLPYADFAIPCFKLSDTEVCLVVQKTLCSFTALQLRPLQTLSENIGSLCGASYYYNSTLYCSYSDGTIRRHDIGSLSN
jgi:hypothetical protein